MTTNIVGRTFATIVAALCLASAAGAATITVVNLDGGGEGFNDPTAVAPVGGNPGATLGAQRLNAFTHAANIWGAQLVSAVTIRVGAEMNSLFCTAGSTILGQAGPNTVHRDFAGALVASTWYSQALANKLNGSDLAPGTDDIGAEFNSAIGTTCPFPNVWYYGLDASPPGGQIDFVTVVLHEIGHGLGFLSFTDDSTGAKFLGFDDVYMRLLEDHSLGLLWPPMSNAQRQASAIDTGDLHWTGATSSANGGFLTSGRHVSGHIEMYAPNPLQPGSSVSHWSTSLFPNQLMEPSYTGPLHATSLSRHLLTDIGWGSVTPTTTTSTTTTSSTSTVTTSTSSTSSTSTSSTTSSTTTSTAAPTTTTTSTAPPTTTTTTLPPPLCGPAPLAPGSCRLITLPLKGSVQLKDSADDTKDLVKWKWKKGADTALADFKDPVNGSATMQFCVYDGSGNSQPRLSAQLLPGGTCGTKPCWKTSGTTGYSMTNKAGTPQGLTKAKFKAGIELKPQVQVQGKGLNVAMPALPLTTPVVVQLLIDDGFTTECWQTTFSTSIRNDTLQFKAKGP